MDPLRLGIIGGGPAGSFFAHFAFRWAYRLGREIKITIFDGKRFQESGPRGCNLCAGVVSRTLQRHLIEEGIFIPSPRIMSWLDGYMLHIGKESLYLTSPSGRTGKIATVFRGNGPRYAHFPEIVSFDDFLLSYAEDLGAEVIPFSVHSIKRPKKSYEPIKIHYGVPFSLFQEMEFDWVIGAFGVNTALGRKIQALNFGYVPPRTRLTFQAEFEFPASIQEEIIGQKIHVFFPRHQRIRYVTLIPKGRFTTLTIIGWHDVRREILEDFYELPGIKGILPKIEPICFCLPRIVVSSCRPADFDRLLFIGDAAFCRYYKNGLESAFLSAKLAAEALFRAKKPEEVSQAYYQAAQKQIVRDNFYGRLLFRLNNLIVTIPFLTRVHLNLVRQSSDNTSAQGLRLILWDMFTGERPYRQIFRDCFQPKLQWHLLKSIFRNS